MSRLISSEEILNVYSQVWDTFWLLKLFKNDEKCFLFHLKTSFRSQDIQLFDRVAKLLD